MICYEYLCRQRPPMTGTVPKAGLIDTRPTKTDAVDEIVVDGVTYNCWGYVIYDRPLTDKEMSDYELRFMATHHKV